MTVVLLKTLIELKGAMPANNSSQKGSIAIIAALAGIAVLTLGIFAGKRLVSQGPRLNPFAIAPPPTSTPTPTPTCVTRPDCLDAPTPCQLVMPTGGFNFCPKNTPTPTPTCMPKPSPLPPCPSGQACPTLAPLPPGSWFCPDPTLTPTPTIIGCNEACNYSVNPPNVCPNYLSCYYPYSTPIPGASGICRNPGCFLNENCKCNFTTPTPTISDLNLPDLVVTSISSELESGWCYIPTIKLGLSVRIKNIGNAAASQFVVDLNGDQKVVSEGLAKGETARIWGFRPTPTIYPYGYPQIYSAFVDATKAVQEINEGNNLLTTQLIMPSQAPTCTPTPTPQPDLIPGDANEDKIVDGLDYVIWLIHYNQETANKHKYGDFDGNGIVNGLDYVMWLNQYFVFHPKPSPIPTCIPPPPCIYGEKQPDGTIIYCDPPPNVIYCPLSPTPTCTPRPACLDAVPACEIPETPDMCPPATNLP